jgi:rare lipoprotein A
MGHAMQSKRLFSLSPAPTARPLLSFSPRPPRAIIIAAFAGAAAISLGGCAQQPPLQRFAHSKEYFPSSKYGPASPRVVADGEPVPRGGGIYMVGKPYSVAGQTYYPSEKHYVQIGLASWYGDAFHGRRTANGEVYDRDSISAAHPTMPLPSYARVTNLSNHYSMIVRVNDRGPFASNRIMDVSRRTAEALNFRGTGTSRVKVEYVGAASLNGSDDERLLATLRLDGPATLDGRDPTAVADAGAEPVRTAALAPLRDGKPAAQYSSSRAEAESQPRRVAKGAATDDGEAGAEQTPLPPRITRQFAAKAPLPPVRPFDLGAARGRVHVAMRSKQAD